MTIGIDGMVSGLDTGAIIDQLVAIQANQQVLLKQKSSAASDLVSALQGLNNRVASLTTAAEKVTNPASWAVTKASSSSDSVTVSADASAKPGMVEFSVTQLASGQISMLEPSELSGTFTITVGEQSHEFTSASGHVEDVAAAINDLSGETGISATRVRTPETDDAGNPVYRLQLTGATGETNAFTVHAGTDTTGPGVDSMVTLASAQDAVITMWPSSDARYELTSSTNTFDDVLDGVSLTVSQQTAEPVTLTVATDTTAQQALMDELVSNVSVVLSEIASRTRTTTSTGSDGNPIVTGGLFSGDSAIRFLNSDIQSAMTSPVNGISPSTIGISIDRDGAISLDKEAFAEALADDPDGTMAAVQTIAGRVAEVAERASNSRDGTLTNKVDTQESVIRDLGTQITKWDERLEARRSQLIAQFTAMEVRLQQLEGTQSWLTNQIAGLNASRE